MAMVDYGALVFKDGDLINENTFFMNMKESVGWEDREDVRHDDCPLKTDLPDLGKQYTPCLSCECRKVNPHVNEVGPNGYPLDCKGIEFAYPSETSALKGNNFAYIGNKDFTIAFYKTSATIVSNGKQYSIHSNSEIGDCSIRYMSHTYTINGHSFHIKSIDERVYILSARIDGHMYHVIYGNGIDTDLKLWNEIKVRYLGKKTAKTVDKYIDKYWSNRFSTLYQLYDVYGTVIFD